MQRIDSHAEFYDTHFSKEDFTGLTIAETHFEDCDFSNVNFTSAQFTACKFINCTFRHCNLSLLDAPNTRFYGLQFTECKLTGIDWTKAYWPDFHLDHELYFVSCMLTSASFYGLKLQGLKMEACRVAEVDFRECDLTGATFSGSELTGSLFNHTLLRGADFTDAWNYSIDVLNNTVTKAKFSRLEAVSLLESLGIELVD
ncbi:pentapeptide repeat-containing protein [Pantoea sp. Fr+CA_20]|uniref:pentapeptide repeat-containing protein n=1 Tax=Pantoea TaxID=53335 RepID=UPI0021184F6B|nr:pentapeptide repeat-containing protein [Pantoea sp. Fr+CA_20]